MKFFMYGLGNNPEEQFDIIIGITANTENEADKRLKELVGEKEEQFVLYDILET